MILEPVNTADTFRPMRQQNVVDAVNANHNIVAVSENADSISVGRGRGIHFPRIATALGAILFKITSVVTGQRGRYNGKREKYRHGKSNATGDFATADVGEFPGDDDDEDLIAWDLELIEGLRVAIPLGNDDATGKPIVGMLPVMARFVFLVRNGGDTGSDTTDCTMTYDMYDINDTAMLTKLNTDGPVDPTGPIPDPKVEYTPGNEGIAQQDGSGAWHLFVLNEAASTEDCATPP